MHHLTIEIETGLVRGIVSLPSAAVHDGERVISVPSFDEAWLGRGIATEGEDGWEVAIPPAPQPTLADLKAARVTDVQRRVASQLANGAPTAGGQHLALDDGSRADLTAMATTAIAAASGALIWPPSYALGWITMENVRVPLPVPADGLALAAVAGDFYAQIVQRGRDLKDAILAAEDEAALSAIDSSAGWPN